MVRWMAVALWVSLAVLDAQAETLRVHVTGEQGPRERIRVRVWDSRGLSWDAAFLTACQEVTLELPSDRRLFVFIQRWTYTGSGAQRFPVHYGPVDLSGGPQSLVVPLPAGGFCGDGAVTPAEVCDTAGGIGCDPTGIEPVCLKGCISCGCGSAEDCPFPTTIFAPCGYGRCLETEVPVFERACHNGVCGWNYRCDIDLSCVFRACAQRRDTQIACDGVCTEACQFNKSTDCWSCGGEGEIVPPPCASPTDVDCLLDPNSLGVAAFEGTSADFPDLRDQLDLGGVSDDETFVLAALAGYFDPLIDFAAIPTLSVAGLAIVALALASVALALLRKRRAADTRIPRR